MYFTWSAEAGVFGFLGHIRALNGGVVLEVALIGSTKVDFGFALGASETRQTIANGLPGQRGVRLSVV